MNRLESKIVSSVLIALFIGCSDTSTESDPEANPESLTEHSQGLQSDDVPIDFEEALKRVETMKTSICKAFNDGTPEDAHDLLHEVGHALGKIPDLAAKQNRLTADQTSEVNVAVEALFDGFGQLDDTLHGGEEVDIADLDKKLTEALNDLKDAVK